jgi:hypothetical protein
MAALLTNQTTNGNGPEVAWNGNHGGEIQIAGTWDGATVTIKGSLDGGTTYTEPPESLGQFTSDTIEAFNFHAPGKIRATLSNAGATTDISAWIEPG